MPLRGRVYNTTPSDRRTDRLFDSTAPEALQDFASLMLDDVWPTDAKPFELRAGKDVPAADREKIDAELAVIGEDIIETVNNSDFRSAAHEAMLDYGIATGVMTIDEGDAVEPLRCNAIPLNEALLDTGPFGRIDALYREREPKAADIATMWPGAVLNDALRKMAAGAGDQKVKVAEGFERDWSAKGTETWRFKAVATEQKHVLLEKETTGTGSAPFVAFSFMRVAGEVYGRGPAQVALPDIMTLNQIKQDVLEYLEFAIAGMWQYEDDGVLNVDTVRIAPGALIPKARNSKGLEPLAPASDFRAGEIQIEHLQMAIRRVLLGDDLGPPTGTPMSATEVMQRTVNRAKRLSGPYGRLLTELLFPLVRRVAHIRKRQGVFDLPSIDGKLVRLHPLSPLTRAQAQDDVLRHDRFLELLSARFGPEVMNLLVNGENYGDWLGGKMGVQPSVLRRKLERRQLAEAITAAAQRQAAAA